MPTFPTDPPAATQLGRELYDSPAIQWSAVRSQLTGPIPQAPGTGGPNRHTCWLATIDHEGRPALRGVGAMYVDGRFVFTSGEGLQKTRNLERDPRCTLAVALDDYDVTIDGTARTVTGRELLAPIAKTFADDGWPCEVTDDGTALIAPFSAQTAGPGPWQVWELDAERLYVMGTSAEAAGAARFDL